MSRRLAIYGLSQTGRIITSAALILLVVIGSFAAGQLVYVQQIGVGIGAAIALRDARPRSRAAAAAVREACALP